ncbi:uncharacterized protein LOC106639497 [Copidosoma floridanum]|uniref:uncharacterized protein LOC106639497 n=1 Tax=Copidosoma floridanum TaxID=29053 RepID=UPI0006C9D872|nr:uncharacterized protein LOC106639497 [Copidosoma floridanum]
MFLILRLFNSFIFVVANLSLAVYTLQRFFRAMKFHRHLVDDVREYNDLVEQSRFSLQYISGKVSEAIKEMQSDVEREVYLTHNLTKLEPKIASASKRFAELEEGIIELARLEHNKENATVATPEDVNEEVLQILRNMRKQPHPQQMILPKSARSHEVALAKEPAALGLVGPQERPKPISSKPRSHRPSSPAVKVRSEIHRSQGKPRSPETGIVPVVSLLGEQNFAPASKPIGFRPPWMCQV